MTRSLDIAVLASEYDALRTSTLLLQPMLTPDALAARVETLEILEVMLLAEGLDLRIFQHTTTRH